MKLHTDVRESKAGLIFKRTIYLMDAQIELNSEETAVIKEHPDLLKFIVNRGARLRNGLDMHFPLREFLKGFRKMRLECDEKEWFEQALHQGCAALKEEFERVAQITAGPQTREF